MSNMSSVSTWPAGTKGTRVIPRPVTTVTTGVTLRMDIVTKIKKYFYTSLFGVCMPGLYKEARVSFL